MEETEKRYHHISDFLHFFYSFFLCLLSLASALPWRHYCYGYRFGPTKAGQQKATIRLPIGIMQSSLPSSSSCSCYHTTRTLVLILVHCTQVAHTQTLDLHKHIGKPGNALRNPKQCCIASCLQNRSHNVDSLSVLSPRILVIPACFFLLLTGDHLPSNVIHMIFCLFHHSLHDPQFLHKCCCYPPSFCMQYQQNAVIVHFSRITEDNCQ